MALLQRMPSTPHGGGWDDGMEFTRPAAGWVGEDAVLAVFPVNLGIEEEAHAVTELDCLS